MAKITLTVIADTQKAEGQIKAFKSNVESAFSKPIQIKINASEADKATKDMIEYAKWSAKAAEAAAKLTNAEVRKINAQTKAAEVAAKLARSQGQQAESAQKAAQTTERLSISSEELARKFMETAQNNDYLGKKLAEVSAAFRQQIEAAQAAKRANEQLSQKYLETAQNDDYLEQKLTELYRALLEEASGLRETSQALVAYNGVQSLVVQNATTTEHVVRSLAQAYLQLAAAAQSAAGYSIPASAMNYISSAGTLQTRGETGWTFPNAPESNANPYSNVSWQRYLPYDYVPNWTWGGSGGAGVDYASAIDVEFRSVASAADTASNSAARASSAFSNFGDSARAAWNTLKEGTPIADALGDSIGNIIVKITTWQVVNGIVASIKRGFTDALDTMKAVDDELVTVRKVTGFTADEMKRVEEQAYKTASAYGVAADAYLESVSAFARAGYKEQSADLAELSTKTQIVGDTTAEVANQFLLSVDAAYKYKGSIEELTKVLDGANELDNKYATSIEKIAEGMGIVAPVAAQMHVSVGELAAAIGTITAVTQRTGSEAARALRALFLNIAGDTKTEIDEGVTWTTGEIEGLRDVIKLYAKDVYDAAQAEGKLIDPMEAIGGLAKSMKEGLLTEQELMSMVSDIGGKLRTSQLLAIIQNWDMYQSMIEDFGNAAGSADKEVSNALDSWTRKTNQLSNAFTEFISHIVSSDGIKAAIDVVIDFVKMLDGGLGKTIALTAAFLGFGKVVAAIGKSNIFNFILNEITGLVTGTVSATTALADLWALISTNPVMWAAAAAAAIYGIVELYDALDITAKEHAENAQKALENYNTLQKEIEELNGKIETNKKLIEEANEAGKDQSYINRLEAENSLLETQITLRNTLADTERRTANKEAKEAYSTKSYRIGTGEFEEYTYLDEGGGYTASYEIYRSATISEYTEHLLELAEAGADVTEELNDCFKILQEINDGFMEGDETSAQYAAEIANLSNRYNELFGITQKVESETEKITSSYKSLNIVLKDEVTIYNELKAALEPAYKALQELNESGAMTESTMKALIEVHPELQSAIKVTTEGFVIEKGAIEDVINAQLTEYQVIYNNAKNAATNLLEAEGIKVNAINATTDAIKNQLKALQAMYFVRATEAIANGEDSSHYTTASEAAAAAWKDLDNAETNLENATNISPVFIPSSGSSSSSGKSGSGGGSDKDPELERLKNVVALEKQRLSFLEASGASTEEKLAQIKKIQDALHDEAEYMRKSEAYIRGDESALKDVLAVSTEWWTYQDKTTKLLEEDAKLAEEIAKTLREEAADTIAGISNELQKQEDAIISPLQEELDALKESHELRKQETEEAEKLLAVEQARIALENAENERNVRIYNAATGQWEWVANPQTVKSARDNLQSAQKNLADFYSEQSYNARVDALENRISVTQATYKDMNAAVKDAAQAVRDGTMTEAQAYETLLAPSLLGIGSTAGYADTLRSLGIVTAMQNSGVGGYGGGVSGTSIGTQNNGNVYQIGGISLSEAQAKSMSVYEFMQLADTLALHGN